MIAQRVMALALGYEDLNDHDRLRSDPALALASGCDDLAGNRRVRARDRGHALAASSTLNRLELGVAGNAASDRCRRIVADPGMIDRLMVSLFLEMHAQAPEEIILDMVATDDPIHGGQEGRFFHGYHRCHCYLPLYIFCGEDILCCRLRTADRDASDGALDELRRIVPQIRTAWPDTRIIIRADSGFCREEIMALCEAEGIDYVFGLARNGRLHDRIGKALHNSRRRCIATGRPSRRFRQFRYRTLKSWSRSRRVVAKAEWLPGTGGENPRFVVTSLASDSIGARELYEQLLCGRGDMENRIKEQQLWLFADRTSSAKMPANQLRLHFSAFAGILLGILHRVGLRGTELASARIDTVRSRLLKLARRIRVTVRRVWLSFATAFPFRQVFMKALANLREAPVRAPP